MMQIPVEMLVQQLQQIPGIHVTIAYDDPSKLQQRFGPNTTFGTWAMYWLNTYKRGVVKDNTYQGTYYEPVVLHLVPAFGDTQLCTIAASDVQEFFRSKSACSALESQKKMKVALRAIFDAAIDNGILWRNPVSSSLRLVSSIPPKPKHTWTQSEYDLAWEYAMTHPAGLDILVLMETGMSRSELLGLRWANHDTRSSLLRIENGLVAMKDSSTGKRRLVAAGTKNKYCQREIPLSSAINTLLAAKPRRIMVDTGTCNPEYIFHGPEGGPYDPSNWCKRIFRRFMADCHLATGVTQLTPHELRHTRATLLKDAGVDIFTIARLLGHSNLDMLAKRYAHDNVETVRKALGFALDE